MSKVVRFVLIVTISLSNIRSSRSKNGFHRSIKSCACVCRRALSVGYYMLHLSERQRLRSHSRRVVHVTEKVRKLHCNCSHHAEERNILPIRIQKVPMPWIPNFNDNKNHTYFRHHKEREPVPTRNHKPAQRQRQR